MGKRHANLGEKLETSNQCFSCRKFIALGNQQSLVISLSSTAMLTVPLPLAPVPSPLALRRRRRAMRDASPMPAYRAAR